MGIRSDLRVLGSLIKGMPRHGDQAQRLDAFYARQAEDYDRFRERLLHGRRELFAQIPIEAGAVLVELGAGTGRNLEFLGERLALLDAAHVVDLCPSLLLRARQRISNQGWTNVHCHAGDAATWQVPGGADVVVMSYALTMMPTWTAVLANVQSLLRPGGIIAVVDFYVSRSRPEADRVRHGAWTRWFWSRWFAHDGVHLDPHRLEALLAMSEPLHLAEARAPVPWLPLRVPYFRYVGRLAGVARAKTVALTAG